MHALDEKVAGGTSRASAACGLQKLDRTKRATQFEMQLIPGESNDVAEVYIDGKPARTGTSWEDYYRYVQKRPSGTSNRLLFRAGGRRPTSAPPPRRAAAS